MREPNFSFPAQNRAAVVISSTLYDRRALDCTATLPLVNSLTHLAYMTSTSPRIREILAADGGLERLVKILATCQQTDRHSMWKWSLAFQSVVNVGVRGTEAIRSRVVETGTVHVVLAILENFLKALEHTRAASNTVTEDDPERNKQQQQHGSNSTTTTSAWSLPAVPTQSRSMPITPSRRFFGSVDQPHPFIQQQQQQQVSSQRPFAMPKRRTFLTRSPKPKPKPIDPSLSTIPLLSSLSAEAVLNREEDVLLSLQLLAYLSKYPHIRQSFHNDHRKNVFSVVEKFTHRIHPHPIMYWAGVIMRNACRKDEARGGIRQCAYMHCGKWERYPREFAKCRRCRKAKYCSKQCQSKAWAEGHRWWCVERHSTSQQQQQANTNATSTTTTTATAAATATTTPAPVVAGTTGGTPQPGAAETATTATTPFHGPNTDVLPIPINERQSDLAPTATTTTPTAPNTLAGRDITTTTTTTSNDPDRSSALLSFTANASADNGSDSQNEDNHHHHHHHHHRTPILGDHPSRREPRRPRSRSSHHNNIPASGSSTEVEADVAENRMIRDLMEVD
ncbi:hypothetical protein O0I10_000041 [Lichtheimia ornata]|uniref:MYND-type domain-containing protein n=1 Tax=Lichtheimia ornata TaxID=688661 RepID=A0AAD8DJI0_9FUNG|nr:uncharacterized protein O0I10_000041 [Lichtheimia ornata]KAJ8663768.1 hypothetical protein O0I10_000041 [Lichtheimia ornata]